MCIASEICLPGPSSCTRQADVCFGCSWECPHLQTPPQSHFLYYQDLHIVNIYCISKQVGFEQDLQSPSYLGTASRGGTFKALPTTEANAYCSFRNTHTGKINDVSRCTILHLNVHRFLNDMAPSLCPALLQMILQDLHDPTGIRNMSLQNATICSFGEALTCLCCFVSNIPNIHFAMTEKLHSYVD